MHSDAVTRFRRLIEIRQTMSSSAEARVKEAENRVREVQLAEDGIVQDIQDYDQRLPAVRI